MDFECPSMFQKLHRSADESGPYNVKYRPQLEVVSIYLTFEIGVKILLTYYVNYFGTKADFIGNTICYEKAPEAMQLDERSRAHLGFSER